MKNKLIIAGIAAAAAVVLVASPALADTFGDLSTINPTGGTSLTDGLKVDIASAQLQVTRDGTGQLYSDSALPDPGNGDAMSNYFTVVFTDGTVQSIAPDGGGEVGYTSDFIWLSGTSSSTLSTDGKSGTVVNTLTSEDVGDGAIVILEVTYTYTYPDQFVNVSTKLTLPVGWTFPTRVYWNTDSTLGGTDEGDQFEGTLSSGQGVRGVVSPDGTQIEAFRQVVGQSVNSWAGDYRCPWEDHTTTCNPDSDNSWVYDNGDAPNTISVETDVDNGFGISTPFVAVAGDHLASFDLLFVGCLDGIPALQCLDAALTPAAAAEPTLPNTGINAAQGRFLAGGGALLALVGAGLVVARRRKVNN